MKRAAMKCASLLAISVAGCSSSDSTSAELPPSTHLTSESIAASTLTHATPTGPINSAPPATISYPSDFTQQDRQFADQAMARGLATPESLAELPGIAHMACTGFKDTFARYVGIEDAALAWADAKRDLHGTPFSGDWSDAVLELGIDNYCPSIRPPEVISPPQRSAADMTFIEGWFELAPKHGLVVATAVMMKQARDVCTELMTAPEWQVAQEANLHLPVNGIEYRKKFVALAKRSYCPNS